jgi:hypothetical protein
MDSRVSCFEKRSRIQQKGLTAFLDFVSAHVRLGVLICDPGDRPEFAEQWPHLVRYQTRKAQVVQIQGHKKEKDIDLVERMRDGCNFLKKECDLIVVVENDDFYTRNYFEKMAVLWERYDRPDLLGFSKTIYYHLALQSYVEIQHPGRASLFATCISASAVDKIKWPSEDEVFLDIKLWSQRDLKKVCLEPSVVECIGIKHGLGKIVSQGHRKDFAHYENHGKHDKGMAWLKSHMGQEFQFYERLSKKLMEADT